METWPKVYMETDKIGEHKVIEQKNGIKVRILKKPSKWYLDKKKKNNEAQKKPREERKIKREREQLIQQKMREIAERELKEEGKI